MADGGLLPVSEGIQTIWDGSTLGVGYTLEFYEVGTSTPLVAYPTQSDAEAETNGFTTTTADSSGRVAVYGSGSTAYKIIVKNAGGSTVKTIPEAYFIPGSTVLYSKTPSEYQIALYENVAGGYKLTNSQTEGAYDFKYGSTGITLGSSQKFFFRDTGIYIQSAADTYLDLAADGAIRFNNSGGVAQSTVLNFVGTNTGVLTWNQSGDLFVFSDDVEIDNDEKLYFRDSGLYLHSPSDGQLDMVADTTMQLTCPTINIEASTALTLESDAITVGESGGTQAAINFFNTDVNITGNDANGSLDLNADTQVKITAPLISLDADDGTGIFIDCNTLVIGDGLVGDVTITYNGLAANGVLIWRDGEDYFEFQDDVYITGTIKTTANVTYDLGAYAAGTPAAATGALTIVAGGVTYYVTASTSAPT